MKQCTAEGSRRGGGVFDALTPGERDYTAILTKLKGANPDVVLFTGYYPEAGLLLRQRKDMNWQVPFWVVMPPIMSIWSRLPARRPPKVSTSSVRRSHGIWIRRTQRHFGRLPEKYNDFASLNLGSAGRGRFSVMVAGIAGAKSTDGDKIAEYLHGRSRDYPGLSGPISFDARATAGGRGVPGLPGGCRR